ncbi:PAS domain-containing sensor histidine kinase, partial [Flavobacterium sp. 3-210]
HKLLTTYFSSSEYLFLSLLKDIAFILITGLVFSFILSKNEKRNITIFEKLNKTNEEIEESNEKYDIVAKATSDTIWDWKIQEDSIN